MAVQNVLIFMTFRRDSLSVGLRRNANLIGLNLTLTVPRVIKILYKVAEDFRHEGGNDC